MNAWVVLGGLGILVVLAALAGLADSRARESAWKSIAERRRANWEERQRLADHRDALLQTAGACPCPGCRLIRHLFGRGNDLRDLM